jgi:hypothetical protein
LISASAALRPAIATSQARFIDRNSVDWHAKYATTNVFPDVAEFADRSTTGNSFE